MVWRLSSFLPFQVRDQDIPVKRNLVRVIVNVEDANDNAPYFTSPSHSARVFETAAVGSAVLQLTARDKDKGHNAEVRYSIESGTGSIPRICINVCVCVRVHILLVLGLQPTRNFGEKLCFLATRNPNNGQISWRPHS